METSSEFATLFFGWQKLLNDFTGTYSEYFFCYKIQRALERSALVSTQKKNALKFVEVKHNKSMKYHVFFSL